MFAERQTAVSVVQSDDMLPSVLPRDVQRLIAASLSEGTKRG